MDHNLLLQMGVTKAGHRIKILRARENSEVVKNGWEVRGRELCPHTGIACSASVSRVKKETEENLVSSPISKEVEGPNSGSGNLARAPFARSGRSLMRSGESEGAHGSISSSRGPQKSPSKNVEVESAQIKRRNEFKEIIKDDKMILSEPTMKRRKSKEDKRLRDFVREPKQVKQTKQVKEKEIKEVKEIQEVKEKEQENPLSSSDIKQESLRGNVCLLDVSGPNLRGPDHSMSSSTTEEGVSCEDVDPQNKPITYYVRSLTSPFYLPADQAMTISEFTQHITQQHKLTPAEPFAIFTTTEGLKLQIVKGDQIMTTAAPYYVIFNNEAPLIKRMEKHIKKMEKTQCPQTGSGKPIWTSDNSPIIVDFIPSNELYISEGGMLGLCMAPGRTKKKKNHDWDRDLDKDLTRIRDKYGCDILVSLVRSAEMFDIQVGNLLEDVRSHGMIPRHYPIKDKWIPPSMEGLIHNVGWIITRLKEGKTVVCHCNGGKGRSGTLIVATLIGLGRKVHQAIEIVRKARSGTIRNPLQIAYVKRFKTAWKKHIKFAGDEEARKREEKTNRKVHKEEVKEKERFIKAEGKNKDKAIILYEESKRLEDEGKRTDEGKRVTLDEGGKRDDGVKRAPTEEGKRATQDDGKQTTNSPRTDESGKITPRSNDVEKKDMSSEGGSMAEEESSLGTESIEERSGTIDLDDEVQTVL
eukprot:TRINITY_DN1972_c0_g1_i2.p1 TRINITY_DN1972_c0_g1~~TRINITY_DN1972_c0_g1_i2.p1  ORF type:complete len:753 (-),score=152.08 TRINITY_DN1972_c0_g1_i2:53-2140(-)